LSTDESTLTRIIKEPDLIRRGVIQKIEEYLKKSTNTSYRVLSYMARFDTPAANILSQDAIMFREALEQLKRPENLALVIHSPGGVIEATEKIGLLLREHVKRLLVIVPDSAKSAATMLALMSNEIHMSDLSELGPIDPQIVVGLDPNTGTPVFRPAWSIINAPFHLESMWKIDKLDPAIVALLSKSLDPTLLDVAQNALDLATTIAEGWLTKYMGLSSTDAKRIAEDLGDASRFHSHSRSIRYPEVKQLGLSVNKMDADLEHLSFELYLRASRILRDRRVKIVDWDTGGLAADM
jgi:Serine dehydrogenase proteinase